MLRPDRKFTLPPWTIKSGAWIPLTVFTVALSTRLLHLFFYRNSPYFIYPVVDAKVYLDAATRIAYGNWWRLDGVFYQAPLYQYFLAGTLVLGGMDFPLLTRLLQAVLGSATALLICLTTGNLFKKSGIHPESSSRTNITGKALFAGLAAALYGPLVYFDCELLNPSLLLFFTYLSLFLLVREFTHEKEIKLRVIAVAGVAAGLSAITGGGILVFVPFFIFYLFINFPSKLAASLIIIFVSGIALIVLPVTIRNQSVGGEPVLISSNAGINFYIGNNPDYEKTVNTRPGLEWNRMANEPEKEGIHTHRGYSSYFFKKSFLSIYSDPVGYVKVLFGKALLLVSAAEIPRNQEIYPSRSCSPVTTILFWKAGRHFVFPSGIMLPLAMYSIFFSTWRKRPGYSLLLLFAGALLLFVFLFFVTSRYRLQAVPALLILSTHGIYLIAAHLKEKKLFHLFLLLPFLLLSNLHAGEKTEQRSADTVYNIALSMERAGDSESAIAWMRNAMVIDPEYHEARMNLAIFLARHRSDYEEAKKLLNELLVFLPDNPSIFRNLAECCRLEGNSDAAEDYLDKARTAGGK